MNQQLQQTLRKELENSFGRKILSSRDCLLLVEDISQKTGFTINANTLRRFFGLVKTAYSASPSTLNILSKYCGFNSIDEIGRIASDNGAEDNINNEEILRYLVSLFRDTPPSGGNDGVFNFIVQQTIIFLERNSSLIDRFQREIAKTTAGQYHYFEQSVNMDRLNSYYGDGLRHYVRGKNTNEARLFANSLQVFRYWLTGNTEAMDKHMSEITSSSVSQNFPPHILGRYIAARLFYANVKEEAIDRILAEAKKYKTVIDISHGESFPDYSLIVCEALILTGHIEEATDYMPKARTLVSGTADSPFVLWEDLVKKKPRRDRPVKTANPVVYAANHHLTKRYTLLVRHFFKNSQKTTHANPNAQLTELIKQTGFNRLA